MWSVSWDEDLITMDKELQDASDNSVLCSLDCQKAKEIAVVTTFRLELVERGCIGDNAITQRNSC